MARPKDPLSRSALIAAARREFVRVGLQKARIEDITRACGLSKGAFYLHFESKEALFREQTAALQERYEALRASRAKAYREVTRRPKDPLKFRAALLEIDGREDRKLLELLWDWRDITDVLLRGSQGTEFAGLLWAMLDHEVSRVETESALLKRAGLMRDDVPSFVIGSMIVGTYLLIARRLSTLAEKPAFEPLIAALQRVVAEGVSPRKRPLARPPARRRRTAPKSARTRRS